MKKIILSVATVFAMATPLVAQIEVNQNGCIFLGDHEQEKSYVEVEQSGRFIVNAEANNTKNTMPLIRFTFDPQTRIPFGGLNLMNISPNQSLSSLNYLTTEANREKSMVSLFSSLENNTNFSNSSFSIYTRKSNLFATRIKLQTSPTLYGGGLTSILLNDNDIAMHIAIGYTGVNNAKDRGLMIDNTGFGQPTIRPYNNHYGYLGTNNYAWSKLYVKEIFTNVAPVILSDSRGKRNIQNIDESATGRLLKMRGVTYTLDGNMTPIRGDASEQEEDYNATDDAVVAQVIEQQNASEQSQSHYGFIAQEVQELFPEAVYYDEENDRYGVRYEEIIPIIVEALKNLHTVVAEQRSTIDRLSKSIPNFKPDENMDTVFDDNSVPRIIGNRPNPFKNSTEIDYVLADDIISAEIAVFDLTGKVVHRDKLSTKSGRATLVFNRSNLSNGVYECVLFCNGKKADFIKLLVE